MTSIENEKTAPENSEIEPKKVKFVDPEPDPAPQDAQPKLEPSSEFDQDVDSDDEDSPTPSGPPEFGFEILKNGNLCGKIPFNKYILKIGRTPENDIISLHPSTSRHHATLSITKDNHCMLVDENSTHGTFVNKKQIQPKIPVRVRVGFFLKFGNSTRNFILTGPDSDQENETEKSYTQMKNDRKRLNVSKKMTPQQLEAFMSGEDVDFGKNKNNKNCPPGSKSGEDDENDPDNDSLNTLHEVNWGQGHEDFQSRRVDSDEENSDDGEGMDLSKIDDRSAYYYNDPEKAINHFYTKERLGEKELVMKKIGKNRWECSLKLPIENEKTGKSITCKAEGVRAEAIKNVCLDACKILDKRGILRSDTSAKKLIERDWTANEYYDSDEDEFLDRTNDLQKKRKRRQEKLGDREYELNSHENEDASQKTDNTAPKMLFNTARRRKWHAAKISRHQIKAYSHEEIVAKLKFLSVEIYKIEEIFRQDKELRKKSETEKSNAGGDSLDAFMQHVKTGLAITVAKRLELRGKLTQFKAEMKNYLNLELAARPSEVKELVNLDAVTLIREMNPKQQAEIKKETKLPEAKPLVTKTPVKEEVKVIETQNQVASVEKIAKIEAREKVETQKSETINSSQLQPTKPDTFIKPALPVKSYGIQLPEEIRQQQAEQKAMEDQNKDPNLETKDPEAETAEESTPEIKQEASNKKQSESEKRRKRRLQAVAKKQQSLEDSIAAKNRRKQTIYDSSSTNVNYVKWTPPKNQSGDGMTDLNKKLGY